MTETANIVLRNNHLHISGDLNFVTVPLLWQHSLPLLAAADEWHFNLEQVTSSNSAGVALLLEWTRHAKRCNKKINFLCIPAQLQSIIQAMAPVSVL